MVTSIYIFLKLIKIIWLDYRVAHSVLQRVFNNPTKMRSIKMKLKSFAHFWAGRKQHWDTNWDWQQRRRRRRRWQWLWQRQWHCSLSLGWLVEATATPQILLHFASPWPCQSMSIKQLLSLAAGGRWDWDECLWLCPDSSSALWTVSCSLEELK